MAPANLFFHTGLKVHPSVRRVMERHRRLDLKTEKTLLLAAQSGDVRSRQTLINHNYALICRVGGKYRHECTQYSLLEDDVLLNQGVIGLHQAIDKWKPNGGARLATFAAWYIRKAMQSDDCLFADETIRIPESARTQLKQINELEAQYYGVMPIEELAEQAEIDVRRINLLSQVHQPTSLNVPADTGSEELIDVIPDPQTQEPSAMQELSSSLPLNIADVMQKGRWQEVLALLPSTLSEVLRLRFWENSTFKAISRQLSIPLNNVAIVLAAGIEALRLQILGRKSLTLSPARKLEVEPTGNREPFCLSLSVPGIDPLYPISIQILASGPYEQSQALQPQVCKRLEAVPDQLLPATQ